jgi:hypothetical protein
MRNQNALIHLLQGLANLLAEEAARNETFARKLDHLLSAQPPAKATRPPPADALPDIHAEWAARGDAGFLPWLQDLPVPVLRAIVKREDLDSARKSAKWRADKLAELIANGLAGRRSRGSGFLKNE